MSAPQTELTPTALAEPGMRGVVRVLGGAGTGKSSLLIRTATGQIAAAAVVITIPVLIVVLLFQKRIVSGLTSGAVKG